MWDIKNAQIFLGSWLAATCNASYVVFQWFNPRRCQDLANSQLGFKILSSGASHSDRARTDWSDGHITIWILVTVVFSLEKNVKILCCIRFGGRLIVTTLMMCHRCCYRQLTKKVEIGHVSHIPHKFVTKTYAQNCKTYQLMDLWKYFLSLWMQHYECNCSTNIFHAFRGFRTRLANDDDRFTATVVTR